MATHSLKCEKYAFSDKKRSNAAETKYFNFKLFSTFYIWRLIYHNRLIEFDEFTVQHVVIGSYGNLSAVSGPSRVITSALSLISRGITFDMTLK